MFKEHTKPFVFTMIFLNNEISEDMAKLFKPGWKNNQNSLKINFTKDPVESD